MRLRPANALLALQGEAVFRLCLALILIRAVLPLNEDVQAHAEELRKVAVAAGCPSPRLSMWTADGAMQVELTCPPSPSPPPPEAKP